MINQVAMSHHETRDRIVETARRLFHEQGYHATGIATILRESGANSGSLYHFFPSKEDLLAAVLQQYIEMLRPVVLEEAERRANDPIERVFALLSWYREGMEASRCAMGCPIGNLALELADNHPSARALIDQNFKNWAAGIHEWLEKAGPRLPKDLDRRQLSRFILTVMEGGIMQSRARGSLEPFDDSVAQLRCYIQSLKASAESTH